MRIAPRRHLQRNNHLNALSPDSIGTTYAFALARILANVFWTSWRAYVGG